MSCSCMIIISSIEREPLPCNKYYLSHNLCYSCHVIVAMQGAGVDEDDEREAMFEQARPASARGPAPAPPRLLNPHPLQLKVVT